MPDVGIWICIDDASDGGSPDGIDPLTSAVPVWEVESYGSSSGTCVRRSGDTLFADELFRVGDSVALGRVRLDHAGHTGPWQTITPSGGYVHFSIGLVGADAWAESVTAEYEFLDAHGKALRVQPYGPDGMPTTTRVSEVVPTCADAARRNSTSDPTSYQPPPDVKAGMSACTMPAARAGSQPGFGRSGWTSELELAGPEVWGAVLSKGSQRFGCSLAPTREVSAVVTDKRSVAKSSFRFAVNPIEATGGSSFWAAGRVPVDVTAITYVLPGGDKVPAQISANGYWMAMYHVDGRDLAEGNTSDWAPAKVTITRKSRGPITYEIPFTEQNSCNQVSHGC